ncbi:Fc.00g036820.m01.CDS01 [Cosmosporella sp. VM-42]
MDGTLPLLKGKISLDDALEEDVDIIRELSYPEKRDEFWADLYEQLPHIAEVVSRHLNIRQSDFNLGEFEEWIHGSYNACIPIQIAERARGANIPRQAIIRFPLPYKVGEDSHPGNIDEKLRSEAATHIWLQQNCPEIPVARLFGFGFPGKQSFTAIKNESLLNRFLWFLRRGILGLFGRTVSTYVPHQRSQLPELGYLVMEHVDNGEKLSDSWEEHRHDPVRRENLFRGLSQMMLRLAKIPLPKIGSWTMDDRGDLKLTNRPLTLLLHQLENAEISTEIPRDRTYTSVEPYLLDLIACHDNRIRYQPNSIHNEGDGESQLAALTAMRAVLPKFTDRQFREGPFVYSLTDLHRGNIFVDDDWNITNITDLEGACSRPIEMLGPPDWLSGRTLEDIGFHLDEYASLHDEFVDVLEKEELAQYESNTNATIMRASWSTGKYWYSHALDSPTTLLALFVAHIQPRFAKLRAPARAEFSHMLMPLWDMDSQGFISSKVTEQEQYIDQLRRLYT